MVAKDAAQVLSALPSVRLVDLAEMWGLKVRVLGEHVKTGQLSCHLLLHHEVGLVPRQRTDWYSDDPQKTVDLNGHYRLPVEWAGKVFEPCGYADVRVVVSDTAGDSEVWVSRVTPNDLRVLREEIERFESEVLDSGRVQAAGRPPTANALMRERCRVVAAMLWEKNPAFTIETVIDDSAFQKHGIANGPGVVRKTCRDWIKDLCPNRRPGRRAEKTPA